MKKTRSKKTKGETTPLSTPATQQSATQGNVESFTATFENEKMAVAMKNVMDNVGLHMDWDEKVLLAMPSLPESDERISGTYASQRAKDYLSYYKYVLDFAKFVCSNCQVDLMDASSPWQTWLHVVMNKYRDGQAREAARKRKFGQLTGSNDDTNEDRSTKVSRSEKDTGFLISRPNFQTAPFAYDAEIRKTVSDDEVAERSFVLGILKFLTRFHVPVQATKADITEGHAYISRVLKTVVLTENDAGSIIIPAFALKSRTAVVCNIATVALSLVSSANSLTTKVFALTNLAYMVVRKKEFKTADTVHDLGPFSSTGSLLKSVSPRTRLSAKSASAIQKFLAEDQLVQQVKDDKASEAFWNASYKMDKPLRIVRRLVQVLLETVDDSEHDTFGLTDKWITPFEFPNLFQGAVNEAIKGGGGILW